MQLGSLRVNPTRTVGDCNNRLNCSLFVFPSIRKSHASRSRSINDIGFAIRWSHLFSALRDLKTHSIADRCRQFPGVFGRMIMRQLVSKTTEFSVNRHEASTVTVERSSSLQLAPCVAGRSLMRQNSPPLYSCLSYNSFDLEESLQPPNLEYCLSNQNTQLEHRPPLDSIVGALGCISMCPFSYHDVCLLVLDLG